MPTKGSLCKPICPRRSTATRSDYPQTPAPREVHAPKFFGADDLTEPAWLTVAESHLHLACKKLQRSGRIADGQDAFPTWEEGCRSGRCGNALPWRHSSLLRPLARVGRHTAWTSCAPCAQNSGSSDFRIKTTTHKTARVSIKPDHRPRSILNFRRPFHSTPAPPLQC